MSQLARSITQALRANTVIKPARTAPTFHSHPTPPCRHHILQNHLSIMITPRIPTWRSRPALEWWSCRQASAAQTLLSNSDQTWAASDQVGWDSSVGTRESLESRLQLSLWDLAIEASACWWYPAEVCGTYGDSSSSSSGNIKGESLISIQSGKSPKTKTLG